MNNQSTYERLAEWVYYLQKRVDHFKERANDRLHADRDRAYYSGQVDAYRKVIQDLYCYVPQLASYTTDKIADNDNTGKTERDPGTDQKASPGC